MLKIYLDWNCITHSKNDGKFSFIQDIAKSGQLIIFPYSVAHIRDLMMSRGASNNGCEEDIKALSIICDKHFLSFSNNQIEPLFVMPKDYIDTLGDAIEFIQKTELITPETYQVAKASVQKLIPNDVFKKIQGAEPKDVIKIINRYIVSKYQYGDLYKMMTEGIPGLKELLNAESRLKCICFGLDLFGFRQEKRTKKFNNIDTDASHIFYASFCDYFVTDDKKLAAKAKAIYSEYSFQTRVLSPIELRDMVNNEIQEEYSIEHMLNCVNEYGIPRMEDDGAHYTLMRTPVLGLFNVVHKFDKSFGYEGASICGIFRYCFQNTPYLYYTEMDNFFNLFENLCPVSLKDTFQKNYVQPMKSRDRETTSKAYFALDCPDLEMQIILRNDNLLSVPCPMMQVIFSPRSYDLVRNLERRMKTKI